MLRAVILLLVVAMGQGITGPEYWLSIYRGQEQLRQFGCKRTYLVDYRAEGHMRTAVYYNQTLGLVTISWPVGREE